MAFKSKKINEKAFIEWRKVYLLDNCNGILIKELIEHKEDKYHIIWWSNNPDPKFEPFW